MSTVKTVSILYTREVVPFNEFSWAQPKKRKKQMVYDSE